jgi:uroporphyrinogen-III synthase
VRAAQGVPLLFPCLHRAPPADPDALADALAHPDGYAVVAVASANGALALGEALQKLPAAATQKLGRALFAAVGSRTAAALVAQGIAVSVIASDDNSGEGLCAAIDAALRARGETLHEKRVLVPRAAVARPELARALRRAGAQVTEAVAYEMVPAAAATLAPMSALLRAGEVDLLPFGSPRTAAIALSALGILDGASGGGENGAAAPRKRRCARRAGASMSWPSRRPSRRCCDRCAISTSALTSQLPSPRATEVDRRQRAW